MNFCQLHYSWNEEGEILFQVVQEATDRPTKEICAYQ